MITIKNQGGNIIGNYNLVESYNLEIKGYQQGSDDVLSLGKYKSEERAQEVMDEIEESIRALYVADMYSASNSYRNSYEDRYGYVLGLEKNAIYTMPKE